MFLRYKYDIAISVAEEDTEVATLISAALSARNITHYYYKKNRANNWGWHILKISLDTYRANAKYVLLLTSSHFVKKYWGRTELYISQVLNKTKHPYLLQLRLDNTVLDGVGEHIIFENWNNNPEEIADILHEKIRLRTREITKQQYRIIWLFMLTLLLSALGIAFAYNGQGTTKKEGIQSQKPTEDSSATAITAPGIIEQNRTKPGSFGRSAQKVRANYTKTDNSVIPAVSFDMGMANSAPDAKPVHTVRLDSFCISKTEITVAQYRVYCIITGKIMPVQPYYSHADDYPVVNITWQEAKDYCKWVGGRLPTEAEWEYAASGGQRTAYSGNNNAALVAVYATNSGGNPDKVGHKQQNIFGLYDMSGNVAEWCADFYDATYYARSSGSNPHGAKSGVFRVVRGGSWKSKINPVNELLLTYRGYAAPAERKTWLGFRVVWDIK